MKAPIAKSKPCRRCGVTKPLSEYYVDRRSGRQYPDCRRCDTAVRAMRKRGELLPTREYVRLDEPSMSHAEIAEALGLTRQRVYQIEQTALEKLRRAAKRFFCEGLGDLPRLKELLAAERARQAGVGSAERKP